MVGYKLSKNDWVTPFFVIFRSVREKLLVTVSFDHPVETPPTVLQMMIVQVDDPSLNLDFSELGTL